MSRDWRRLANTWETWAQRDRQFAILSSPEVRDWDRERFMAHTWEADHALGLAAAHGFHARGTALDFGCGVGRLTQRLGDSFEDVVGLDISPTMVEEAQRLNRHGDGCRYVCGSLDQLPDASFDFILSVYVIQHIPPALQAGTLRDLVRKLRRDGTLVINIHSGWRGMKGVIQRHAPAPILDWRWRQRFRDMPRIEMNPLSPEQVASIIEPAGRVIARERDWYVIGRR